MRTNYKLLIRTIIEFCVTIQDYNFLFYDVFDPFKEQKLEALFLEELKPFILAGRLAEWELPNDLLENHIVRHYKDPECPEVLERILINLNLTLCDENLIEMLIQFCDTHMLTTGLIYLRTCALSRPHE